MKEETRKRLSELILEELSERIRHDDTLRKMLEPFTELPVEKVAETVLNNIHLLLTDDLRDSLASYLEHAAVREEETPASIPAEDVPPSKVRLPVEISPAPASKEKAPEFVPEMSIMKHFSLKEPFPFEAFALKLSPDDWFYLYGVSYAPDSTGKGVPKIMLTMKGADQANNIFVADSGDIRLYLSKLSAKDYGADKNTRPILTPQQDSRFRFEHENILNVLRTEEALVALPHWTIYQGMEEVLRKIEERYVDLLRVLVEVHDAADWDLELFAFDHHILQLPSINASGKTRTAPRREVKHGSGGRKDDVLVDKVLFREKSIAQDIHNQLILTSQKSKVDFMIRLDTAFMDDWKSILAARYSVSKDKRKQFWQTVKTLHEQYQEYELMMKIRAKSDQFTL